MDEVKNPTVAITVGEATETSIAFTITSTAADEVKYLVVEASEATPTATEVLTNGTVAEANVEAGCYVAELKAETEYTIVAAAKNAKAVVKAEVKMTTKGNGNEPEPPTPGDEYDVEFKADDIYVAYYGDMYSAAYNYYVILSDVGVNLKETDISFKENGIYYIIDLYAADAAENNNFTVPNGTYKAATSSAAGTFGLGDYGAGLNIVNGEPTYYIYASGEVVVSENKIVATITMEDGQKHQITYEGSLYFGENGDEPTPLLVSSRQHTQLQSGSGVAHQAMVTSTLSWVITSLSTYTSLQSMLHRHTSSSSLTLGPQQHGLATTTSTMSSQHAHSRSMALTLL